jgi:trans-2,3-dihydro-3-hydroxyanthranilate isomerase
MLCVENNQLIEDAATGSASTFAGFSLKYHAPDIQIINHQGNTSTDRHKFILMEN